MEPFLESPINAENRFFALHLESGYFECKIYAMSVIL